MATAARKLTPTEARVAAEAATPANRELVARLFPEAAAGELPGAPWFRLDTYRTVRQWTDVDWFVAICIRWSQWAHLEGPNNPAGPPPIARVAAFIKGLAADPITGGQGRRIEPGGPVTAHSYGARVAPIVEVDPDGLADLADEHAFGSLDAERPLLRINMEASNLEILAAFKAWLNDRRPKAQRSAMTEADMAGWRACQVIPYLDIRLFELASGSKIRGVDIQRALFPGGADPKKTLEQSTRTHANRLMSTRFYGRLHAQFGGRP